ncbi:Ig-like domain-containing protein [Aquimarina sp. 2201CG1-2-11]|uniref:Ig-like domain-containing protein n=1 Tax=Aquimarina discodermiae TaxID=3231043 RepID=UPI0034629091
MKNSKHSLILFIITSLLNFYGYTQLAKGDLAIVGFNSDVSPDQMALVALANIPSGQTIHISDYPWDGAAFNTSSTSNGALTWTTTSSVPAGTLLNITITTPGIIAGDLTTYGSVSSTGWTGSVTAVAVASGGDSWLIYQGASPTGTPSNWVYGFANWSTSSGTNPNEWRTSGSVSTTTSYLPTDLTLGTDAVAITTAAGGHADNLVYGGTLTGDKATILAAISTHGNWSGSETAMQDISPGGANFPGTQPIFTVSGGNTAPVIGGTLAGQAVNDNSTITPFSTITTIDADGDNLTATITLDTNAKGVITGADSGTGPYTMNSRTTAAMQTAIRALSFNPTDNRTSTTETTTFTVLINDGADNDSDNTTTVISSAVGPNITAISIPNAAMKVNDMVTATITVDSDTDDYTTGSGGISGTIGGFTLGSLSRTNSTTYTAVFTVSEGGTDIAAGSTIPVSVTLTDSGGKAGNTFSTPITQNADAIDANSPSVTSVAIPNSATKVGDNITVTVIASEAGLSLTSGSVNGVVVTGFSDDGGGSYSTTYTVAEGNTDRAAGDNIPVSFVLTDAAGNNSATFNTAISQNADAIDANSPSVTNVTIPNSAAKVGDNITVTITASEAGLSLTSGSVNGVAVTGFSDDSGGSYSATYTIVEGNTDRAAGDNIPVSFVMTDAAGNNSSTFNTAISQNADTIDANSPSVTDVTIPNSAAKVGDNITVTITASEAGLSLTSGSVNGVNVTGFSDDSGGSYSATYTVAEGNTDRAAGDNIPVSFILADATGNNSAAFTTAISQNADAVDANSPSVTSVSIPNSPAKVGDNITVTIIGSEAGLSLTSGSVNGVAVTGFSDDGSGNYSATYTVAEGNTDRATGDDIPVSFVLADAAGNNSATFNTAISQNADAIDANSPSVTNVTIPNSAAKVGDNITVTITASESGLSLASGSVNGVAVTGFSDDSGGSYSATYTIVEGNTDRAAVDNIPVSFVLADPAGNNSATFNTAISQNADAIDANSPSVTNVTIPNSATKVGDNINVSITASEAGLSLTSGSVNGVTVTGFSDDSGGNYSATYTVAEGNTDRAVGDDIPVSFVLADAAGNNSAAFTTAISQNADAIDANSPSVTSVSIPNSATKVGDNISVTITASEAGLSLTSGTVNGVSVTGFSDDGGGNYSAVYTVAEGNTDRAAGDNIPVSFVLADPAGNNSASFTTAISQNADAIDANSPVITNVSIPNVTMNVNDVVTATITVNSDTDDYTTGSGGISGTIGGFALGSLSKTNNTIYTATFTILSSGTSVAAGDDIPVSLSMTDSAGNTGTTYTTPISQASDPIFTLPSVAFASTSSSNAESVSSTNLAVNLFPSSASTITVNYAVTGTATAGTDYTLANGTLTFSPGSTSENITIASIINDAIVESDETIIVTLSNPSNANLGTNTQHTYTITNDDTAAVTIDDVMANENTGSVTFTLTLDNEVDGGFDVDVSTADGTATTADSDYTAISASTETFTGNAGETQTIVVTLGADTKVEADETFTVSMSALVATTVTAGNISITDGATGTITNDDNATVTIANVSGNEDDGAITVVVTLDNAVDGGFDVDVNTADGTATTANNDYTAVNAQTLTFAGTANETETFTVTPTADIVVESNETLTISINSLVATTVSSSDIDITDGATITILNDDITITAPTDVCINSGTQTGLGSGLPTGGVYSGPGVTDDSNGMTYSFDPSSAGAGVHTIIYTVGIGSANDNIEVFAIPTVTFTPPSDLCIDAGIQTGLSGGTPTGGTYSGPGVTDDGNGMTYSLNPMTAGTGTHTITYSFTDGNNCSNSSSSSVTVTTLDDASFNYSATAYCIDGTDPTPTITGLTGGLFSSTPSGLSISSSSGAIDVSDSTPNTYTITYTTTGTCAQNSNTTITINALDDASFNYDAATYSQSDPDPTPIITGLAGGTFSVTPAGLNIDTGSGAINLLESIPDTYTITYTTSGNCPNSTTIDVTINDNIAPTATITLDDNDLTIGETATVTITFSEAITGFDNSDLTIPNGTLSPVSSSDGGITFTAAFTPVDEINNANNIIILDNTKIADLAGNAGIGNTESENFSINTEEVVIPTISFDKGFSPNGDGVNDTWVIEGLENFANHTIQVFNRSGNKIFEAKDYQNDWDGTSNGNLVFGSDKLPPGPYYFIIESGMNEVPPKTGWIYINY